ncbi:MAG TPA: O-antigen ligase family protein [Myxococcaceae bacterium]|nr:O-antigen ligase family protein [Myxococcaceae bacterium]
MARNAEVRRDVYAFAALVGFAVVMYAAPGEWISAFAPLRLALTTSVLAAGLMLLRRVGRSEPLVLDGTRGGALILFALWALTSMAWSVRPDVSRFTGIELIKLVAIYVTLVNVVQTPRRLAVLCAALVISSSVTSLGVIQWYMRGVDLVEGFRARWIGVYTDPNHMAMNMAMVVPLAVAFIARRQTRLWLRLACLVAAGLAVTAIVFSHSRGGFIGLAASLGVWALRERRKMQALMVGAVLGVGLLIFAPESFWKRNETVTEFEKDASALGRVYAWEVASNISTDRPLLGVGAGAFKYAWFDYARPEAKRAYVAHNIFLDVIGELGFVGLFLFLVFVGGTVSGAFEASFSPEHGWLARAIAAAAVGYLLCDLFSGYLLSAHFYVLLGLAAAAQRIASAASHTSPAVRPAPGTLAGAWGLPR